MIILHLIVFNNEKNYNFVFTNIKLHDIIIIKQETRKYDFTGGVFAMVIDALKFRLALIDRCKGNKEFAEEAGVCEGTVAKLCKADCKVRNTTVGRIARALGCDPMELLKEA